MFSPDGWSLVGEAGVFTDPFYSPGSDFIAIGNDMTTDLIMRATAGEDVSARADAFNASYLRLYEAFLRLYDGQYRLMGNAQVMTAKAAWDNACYWAISALLYFQRRYRDPAFMASIEPLLRRFFVLHARMQQLFRAWDLADAARYADGFTNVTFMESLFQLQSALAGPRLQDDELGRVLEANLGVPGALRAGLAGARRPDRSVTDALRAAGNVRAHGHLGADVPVGCLRELAVRCARLRRERRRFAATEQGRRTEKRQLEDCLRNL